MQSGLVATLGTRSGRRAGVPWWPSVPLVGRIPLAHLPFFLLCFTLDRSALGHAHKRAGFLRFSESGLEFHL